MTDIRVKIEQTKFDVRACGVLIENEQLLVSTESDGSKTLTGGAVKLGEDAKETVTREFLEETGLSIQVNKLIAIVENFFETKESAYQQIIFVFSVSLKENEKINISCQEKTKVSWVSLDRVTDLQPYKLNELIHSQMKELTHIVSRD